MKTTSIAALAELEIGDVIPGIAGRLTRLWEPETKQGQYGDFTTQNGEIEEDGHSIQIRLQDCPLPLSVRGRFVAITSTKVRGALRGVELDEWNGKRRLKIGKSAKIEVQGQTPQVDHDAEDDGPPKEAQAPAKSAPRAPNPVRTQSDFMGLVVGISKIAILHRICHRIVNVVYDGVAVRPEQIQAATASTFIEACKQGGVSCIEPAHASVVGELANANGDIIDLIDRLESQIPTAKQMEEPAEDEPEEVELEVVEGEMDPGEIIFPKEKSTALGGRKIKDFEEEELSRVVSHYIETWKPGYESKDYIMGCILYADQMGVLTPKQQAILRKHNALPPDGEGFVVEEEEEEEEKQEPKKKGRAKR